MNLLKKINRGISRVSVAGFNDLFMVDSTRIEDKKDVIPYIRAEALRLLKDDSGGDNENFYYCYTYNNQVLNFLVARNQEYIAGKLPVIAPAFFTPGRYFYRSGRRYFVIEHHTDGTMTTDITQTRPVDCTDLTDLDAETIRDRLPDTIPSTLHLQWSQAKRDYHTEVILAVMALLSLCFMFYQGSAYDKVVKRARTMQQEANMTPAAKHLDSNIGVIPELIRDVAAKIGTKGEITSIKGDESKIVVTIRFDNELESREFIKKFGGVYEDGKVLLGYGPASGNGAVSGH